MAEIYHIRDKTNDVIMYVGQTKHTHKKRFTQHQLHTNKNNSHVQPMGGVFSWIRWCKSHGYEITSELICKCDYENRIWLENVMFGEYMKRGHFLWNKESIYRLDYSAFSHYSYPVMPYSYNDYDLWRLSKFGHIKNLLQWSNK